MGRPDRDSVMKKIFLILSASLGVLAHPSRQKRQEGELGLAKEGFPASKEVADGVYSFSNDGFYMSMFVVTQEGVMVVDPMNNNQAKAMLAAIREVTQAPIRYLFLSHNHYDHIKGAQVFKDEGASVISHIEAYEYMKANPTTDVILPDQTWSGDRKDFTLGGVTMELHYLGLSHGLGMTSFLLQPQKVGYIADNSVPNGLPFVFFPDFNLKGLENTLKTYMSYDVDQIIYSHSNLEDPLTPGNKEHMQFWLDYVNDLRVAVQTEIQNGGNPFALNIELPKYENLPFYKEWLPINALFVAMNEFLGPLGWRPTNTEPAEVRSAAPTRNSIFASAPKTEKSSPSPVFSSGVSTSRWLPSPNPWSKNTSMNPVKHYKMKFQHNLQQFGKPDVHSSHYHKWNNYLNSQSMWG